MSEIKISLRAARINAGMTQTDAAKALHRTKHKLGAWEAGSEPISYADMLAVTELYQIPIENIRLYDARNK